MYKCRVCDFEDSKASVLGTYIPTKLKMDEGEAVITMIDPDDYKGSLLFVFENGKAARIELASYETKTNRKKLINAYSDKSPLVTVLQLKDDIDIACYSSDDRVVVFNSSLLQTKTSRSSQGVGLMILKAKRVLKSVIPLTETQISNVPRYRVRSLPAAGALLKNDDREEQQLSLLD